MIKRMMTVKRVTALAKMLGFKKDNSGSGDVFVREKPLERSYIYKFVDNPKGWRVSIYRKNLDWLKDIPTERVEIVTTEEDVLVAFCRWYMELGKAIVKKEASDIARENCERIERI